MSEINLETRLEKADDTYKGITAIPSRTSVLEPIKQCVLYWWEFVTSSKDTFDRLTFILPIPLLIIAIFLKKDEGTEQFLKWPIFVLGSVFTLRCIFWLPFKEHKVSKEKYESQIGELKAELEGKTHKADARQALAGCLILIEKRISEIRKMSPYAYVATFEARKDVVSNKVLELIAEHLEKNVDPADAVLFTSLSGFLEPHIDMDEYYGAPETAAQIKNTARLKYFATKIVEIMERYT